MSEGSSPDFLQLEDITDGTKNCIGLTCKYGCMLTEQNCERRLAHTCPSQLRIDSFNTKCRPHITGKVDYYHAHTFVDTKRFLCYWNTGTTWEETLKSSQCNSSDYYNIYSVMYNLGVLYSNSKYFPVSKPEAVYWVGDAHYTCDSGECSHAIIIQCHVLPAQFIL